jgi:hypothetical protein
MNLCFTKKSLAYIIYLVGIAADFLSEQFP